MLTLYNTATRKKERFVPLKKGEVTIYSCGSTVYDVAHIGNLSSFLFVDLLRRWLEKSGYKVKHVINITDVDDKIIRNCFKTLPGLLEYTEKFNKLLFEDMKRLNLIPAEHYPKATDHVREMVELIKILLEKGYAYEKDGSVYFQISSFPSYGKFANLNLDNLRVGARVDSDEYDKNDVRDFVLWKGWKPEEDGEIYWDTEIGRGRPGWHIECSAMSLKYLGETIDIHTGGVDLVFPHHQNEIAQSEAATGKPFVNYWLHREFLNIGGDKMSKSAGSGASLSNIAPEEIDSAAFRYLVVTSHYRMPLNFTDKSLEAAKNSVTGFRNLYSRLSSVGVDGSNQLSEAIASARIGFGTAMDDDLGSPRAIAEFFSFLKKVEELMQDGLITKESASAAQAFMREIDAILGVHINAQSARSLTSDEFSLIAEREIVRKEKDWKRSDEIRSILEKKGVILEDTPKGTRHFFV